MLIANEASLVHGQTTMLIEMSTASPKFWKKT